jgi:hypothetical protein
MDILPNPPNDGVWEMLLGALHANKDNERITPAIERKIMVL